MRIPFLAYSVLMILIVHASNACAGPCPKNNLNCNNQSFNSSAPADSIACSYQGSSGSAKYSIPNGILETFGNSFLLPAGGSIAYETVADSFVVLGPGSSPVSIRALLHVHSFSVGSSNGSGQFTIKMKTASDQLTWNQYENTISTRDSTMTLAIQAIPNQPFILSFYSESYGTGVGSARVHSQLSFADIPQGMVVASCQGYQQDAPVPTQALTWGHLKAHYR